MARGIYKKKERYQHEQPVSDPTRSAYLRIRSMTFLAFYTFEPCSKTLFKSQKRHKIKIAILSHRRYDNTIVLHHRTYSDGFKRRHIRSFLLKEVKRECQRRKFVFVGTFKKDPNLRNNRSTSTEDRVRTQPRKIRRPMTVPTVPFATSGI
jgi:hypothetical protein